MSAANIMRPHGQFSQVDGKDDPAKWLAAACPAEQLTGSCYYHNQTRGKWAEQFVIPGVCQRFSASTFLALTKCRTILFIGDSILAQLWTAVVCMLPAAKVVYEIDWDANMTRGACPPGSRQCGMPRACAVIASMQITICYVHDVQLEIAVGVLKHVDLPEDSLVIANMALRNSNPKVYRERLESVTRNFRQMRVGTYIWFETPAQHYPYSRPGYREAAKALNATWCAPINTSSPELLKMDWRNRVAEAVMWRSGFEILRTWNTSIALWDAHVQNNGTAGRIADCAHYCLPGLPQAWAVYLMTKLQRVVKVGKEKCGAGGLSIARNILEAAALHTKDDKKPGRAHEDVI